MRRQKFSVVDMWPGQTAQGLRQMLPGVLLLALTGTALPADLTGQASIIDGEPIWSMAS
jgi:hypothetical protein